MTAPGRVVPLGSAPSEARWRALARSTTVLSVVITLMALGIANIVMRARSHPVEDGVLWGRGPSGVTALQVAPGSGAALAGLRAGDVLLAVNGSSVTTAADVFEYQHRGHEATRLGYTVVRSGAPRNVDVALAAAGGPGSMYFVLAVVGLFTLLVGASVRLKRPRDQATLHFFWLCVAFFGTFTFSFTGPLDRLDWTFYWGDAVALALLPPLLLHFTLGFPSRPGRRDAVSLWTLGPVIYGPALLLLAARIVTVSRGASDGALLSSRLDLLDRVEPVYLVLCAFCAVGVLIRAFGNITSVTGRRQLRWIAWGTMLGVGPFALGYALPWAFGVNPPLPLQFTAILLIFVPLSFASAIVRYRLRDVEVIIKRGVAYSAFLLASIALYVAFRKAAGPFFGGADDPHTWVLALMATIIVVLLTQPVRQVAQDALDRLFYRDRYDYRRALVGFARDLNTDLDVVRLSQRLVTRIVETLVVDRMALMLADERQGDFRAIGEFGFPDAVPCLLRASSFMSRLGAGHTVALDDPIAAAWFEAEEVDYWRDQGIYYFVPCVFEGEAIAVLALGRKQPDEPFNSEDFGLLTAVAGQVATALENGRLYRQLHIKAEELGRMREFNDNILESLDDGLVVFDEKETIIRWNRALERFYGVKREEAVGRMLSEVFDGGFIDALRTARIANPDGATLFKVSVSARSTDQPGAGLESKRLLVNATTVPLQGHAGADGVVGSILLLEDVTDQVRLEEHLQISEKMASIGLLAAGVAHEVNTPLTGISSYTQMLLEQADPADPRTALLEKIERQTFRAAKIVNGLLTLSRPGTPGGERTLVDVNTIIADVCSLLEHQFEMSRIKIRRELSKAPVRVFAIEHQLQQVFLNLFLNARDAMPSGGWLTVKTDRDGQHAIAEVSDTGSGIRPEHLARIYDPFFTTKSVGRGTGLGLSISYGILREHDGVIQCESAIGTGTRFTISMPEAIDMPERNRVRQ